MRDWDEMEGEEDGQPQADRQRDMLSQEPGSCRWSYSSRNPAFPQQRTPPQRREFLRAPNVPDSSGGGGYIYWFLGFVFKLESPRFKKIPILLPHLFKKYIVHC